MYYYVYGVRTVRYLQYCTEWKVWITPQPAETQETITFVQVVLPGGKSHGQEVLATVCCIEASTIRVGNMHGILYTQYTVMS